MTKQQFRVLYRQFLFRMVDLELLSASAQGDISKLLGQLAGLLIFFSSALTFGALVFNKDKMPPAQYQAAIWGMEHFLISTTMLVVGLFAVLSWDSTFPDRRDVMVLAPLPIRARTLFFAKVLAAGSALALTVVALNCMAGFSWPGRFVPKGGNGFRTLAAYWTTVFTGGTFNFCCMLGIQGLAAQALPRRYFLRLSAFLQMAAFCLFVSSYFLEPSITTPAVSRGASDRVGAVLLVLRIFSSTQRIDTARVFRVSAAGMDRTRGRGGRNHGRVCAVVFPHAQENRRRAGHRAGIWRGALAAAFWKFARNWRSAIQHPITLARSRQHRVMLAFFLGGWICAAGFRVEESGTEGGGAGVRSSIPLLFATVAVMCITVVGTRVVFSMPISLRANWIFRVTQASRPWEYMAAIRRPLFVLAVAPVWIVSAALLFSMWPRQMAASHLVVLGLLGTIVAYVCLAAFRKIPFTCSYLPGKSYLHMAFLTATFLMLFIIRGVVFESAALRNQSLYASMVAFLAIVAVAARWWAVRSTKEEDSVVQFEEVPAAVLQTLGLNRDGVVTTEGVG